MKNANKKFSTPPARQSKQERDLLRHEERKKSTKMKREKKTMILTPRGLRRQIQNVGLGSRPTIIKALSGAYNEYNPDEKKKAERIRRYALNNGGVEVK